MSITGTVIGILIMAILVLFAVFSTKEVIQTKKELKELEKETNKAKENSKKLKEHNEKSNEIKEEKIKTQEEINNAKTKEELIAAANSIADNNNDKLRKQGQEGKGNNTSTKTSKTRTSKTNRK